MTSVCGYDPFCDGANCGNTPPYFVSFSINPITLVENQSTFTVSLPKYTDDETGSKGVTTSVDNTCCSTWLSFDSTSDTLIFELQDSGILPNSFIAILILDDGSDSKSYNLEIDVLPNSPPTFDDWPKY